ncbi:hypothetical protein PFNF54_05129 [Plasmodium falciparum NF54]|uniref:Uncharacterized protein n=1 Tax=Plasmodium falciparum (isolate NF54) TaxID=5843 RepID=W7JZA7_PLAFO|nr:hypothetical protein PFNF54_05129 [Plasmodium falciparum NF54]
MINGIVEFGQYGVGGLK